MSTDDRIRWDQQHLNSSGADQPAAFLREIIESDSWQVVYGTALDIACGKGRNAMYLAQRGFAVTALDISMVALDEGRCQALRHELQIDWQQRDLETDGLVGGPFDLIINFNYLQRSLWGSIRQMLKPGGHVIFETYLVDQAVIGHPKNPDYLLRHNELLASFEGFRVLFCREGKFVDGHARAFRASIFAQKI